MDFKGDGETEFLQKYVGIPEAGAIFQTIQETRDRTKIHIEMTDLVIPGVGNRLEEARRLSRWVYDNLGPDCPVHSFGSTQTTR